MRCDQWQEVVEEYRSAVRIFSTAVDELRPEFGLNFTESWQKAERAKKNLDLCRAAVLQHEHDHGCIAARHKPLSHQNGRRSVGA